MISTLLLLIFFSVSSRADEQVYYDYDYTDPHQEILEGQMYESSYPETYEVQDQDQDDYMAHDERIIHQQDWENESEAL